MSDPSQRRAWAKRLEISLDKLEAAIAKVGNSVSAVTKEIKIQKLAAQENQPAVVADTPAVSI
jgi:hypothetical protein